MKNFGEFFNNQVETAKCIVLSHTDDLSEEKLHECIHLLKEKNHDAVIVSTPWDKLLATQIIEAIEGAATINKELEELENEPCHICGHHHEHHHEHHHHHEDGHCCCGHHHDHEHGHEHSHEPCHDEAHHGHHHHADEVFQSVAIETAKKFTKEQISSILDKLSDEEKYGDVLRAKGYVTENDDNWIYFDYIPGTIDVRYGSASIIGRICVIGADIKETAIKELFGA